MKKFLVIADVGTRSVDPHNFLNTAIGNQAIPSGATRLAANSWLIDAHTCLQFFASLVIAAQKNDTPLVVLPIDDGELIFFPHQTEDQSKATA
jgi:hypothetical protein